MHPPEPQPRQRRDSVRRQARLDAETSAKLEALARTFHRKRAQILRHVMQWGLTHTQGWTVNLSIPDCPHLVHMLVELDLLQQVQTAAEPHHSTVATWLRQAVRQVTADDFAPSWDMEKTAVRSHESSFFHRKFDLRLDEVTSRNLEALTETFNRSAAEIIRQLIAQASSKDVPSSWHMAAMERRPPRALLRDGGGDGVR